MEQQVKLETNDFSFKRQVYILYNTNYNNDDFSMVKVLLVEDNPLNMELIIEILRSQGFTVDTAVDGEKAVDMAEKYTYDIILMDIALPGIDGVETSKKIKSKPQYKNVPFVALTAFAMAGDKERLLNAGFNEYVSKPLEVHEFVKKMEKYRK
ncbi:MAG: response regulator [Candidatus Methanoperedens sp.]|nr:response regulator [Candidatus Methanoperedens sp.]